LTSNLAQEPENRFLPKKGNITEWLRQASLQDKKGLRVINAVIKNKGNKRFRTLRKDKIIN
jgi:hypothetical protein